MDSRWGGTAHRSASGQETGEGGGGGWTSASHRPGHESDDAEMAPMLGSGGNGSSSGSGGGGNKGNDKIGGAFRRLAGGDSANSNGKYHGSKYGPHHSSRGYYPSCRSVVLIGATFAAMIYLGYSVGLGGTDGGGSGGGALSPQGGGPSPTPLVRKKPSIPDSIDARPDDADEMDDDAVPVVDEEDPEKDSGEGSDDDDDDDGGVGSKDADGERNRSRAPDAVADDDDDAVVEDADAVEDDENEDDDATQNFADDDAVDNDDDDDDDSVDNDDDDTEEKDGTADTAAKTPAAPSAVQQDLNDDDSVVDDDAVSSDRPPSDDDDAAGTDTDDDDSVDDEDGDADLDNDKDLLVAPDDEGLVDEDGNPIAMLIPGGVSTTPSVEYRIPSSVHKRFIKWSDELHQVTEMDEYKGGEPKVNWEWHPRTRKERFPSVEERIKYYMGKWFDESIKMYGHKFRQTSYAAARTTRAYGIMSSYAVNLFNLTQDGLLACDQEETSVLHAYCRDYVDLAILHHGCTSNVILHLGDSIPNTPHKDVAIHQYPVLNKVRHFCDPKFREQTGDDLNPTCGTDDKIDAIIWPMNRIRHLSPAAMVYKQDTPWKDKVGRAIWRGGSNDPFGMKTKFELVNRYVDSDLVDAKFAKRTNKRGRGKNKDIDEKLMAPFISQEEQLKYKYLISIEGNDVSSGLKWMLFSNSVVMLPPTTYESWAMEGLLEPFVHYIPIKSDASDVEEKVQWAEDHPEEAQKIAERSTLFIYDLLFHPEALSDEQEILEGIAAKYETNFGYAASRSVKGNHPLQHVHWDWHPSKRSERFPSVEDRVAMYLGKWDQQVLPMERDDERNPLFPTMKTNAKPKLDAEFIATGKELSKCAELTLEEGGYSPVLKHYCEDAIPFFDERLTYDLKGDRHPDEDDEDFRLYPEDENLSNAQNRWFKRILIDDTIKVVRFGDSASDITNFPVFTKARKVKTEELDGTILWPMGYTQEYELVESGLVEYLDVPFKEKKPKAVWRGGFGVAHPLEEKNSEFKHRISLVERAQDESNDLIDAVFVFSHQDRELDHKRDRPLRPKEFIYEPKDDDGTEGLLQDVLSNRYLIATEDDFRIDSDLKWMLLSQSVVFMATDRRFVSWFMEQELESYVHYVPIKPDYSDVEEQVKWCEKNIDKCEKIAERATLFVHDMLFHGLSEKETSEIQFRIMERYTYNFNGLTPEITVNNEDEEDEGKKKKKDGKDKGR